MLNGLPLIQIEVILSFLKVHPPQKKQTPKKKKKKESASKYCISDSFVDYVGHSISSKRFLPTVVDIMVL